MIPIFPKKMPGGAVSIFLVISIRHLDGLKKAHAMIVNRATRVFKKIWAVIFVLGCQGAFDSNTLIGIYLAEYPYGTEQLVLNSDGTYQQLFAPTGQSLQVINIGRWEVRELEGRKLVLRDAVFVDNGFGEPAKTKTAPRDWLLQMKKSPWGPLRLPVNEDLGIQFSKIN